MLRKLVLVASVFLAGNVWAGADDVMVEQAWMRESVPGQTMATVQLNLYTTKPARLVSVRSPLAKSGEIQAMGMYHGKMQARAMDSLRLEAHSNVIFGTRNLYLALVGLKRPLAVGDRVPVSLVVEVGGKSQEISVEAEVRALELSYQHYNDPAVKDHR